MTSAEARDAIYKVMRDAWDAAHPILWDDVPSKVPDEEIPWARVKLTHVTGAHGTINGQVGCRRFDSTGFVTVQVFAPVGDGKARVLNLAQTVRYAYEDARLPVWFRNIRVNEIGPSGNYQQINVIADFEYDTVR